MKAFRRGISMVISSTYVVGPPWALVFNGLMNCNKQTVFIFLFPSLRTELT